MFTIIRLENSISLQYVMLQPLCGHNIWCVVMLCPKINVLYFCISNFEVCAQCQIWLFSVFSWCSLQVFLDSFWMVLRWFQLPQLLLILLLFLYFTYILKSCWHLFVLGQSWWKFLMAHTQILGNFWRNFFAFVNLGFLAPYFRLFHWCPFLISWCLGQLPDWPIP